MLLRALRRQGLDNAAAIKLMQWPVSVVPGYHSPPPRAPCAVVPSTPLARPPARQFSALPRSGLLESFHRARIAATSAITAFVQPERADAVAALGEATGELALESLLERMKADPGGRQLLQSKPLLSSSSLQFDRLRLLDPNTFGFAYHEFMASRGFSPDERPSVRHIEDPDLAYVMLRYRQVHDFWHVLAGVPTTVLGELALKWFEMVHTKLPGCAVASFFGPLRLTPKQQLTLWSEYVPWASHAAQECEFLLVVPYEELLDLPLEEVRQRLKFCPAPAVEA